MSRPLMRGWTLLAGSSLAAVLVAGGCGEGRNYQAGFAEAAAMDEDAYKAAEAAKAAASKQAANSGAKPAAPRMSASAGAAQPSAESVASAESASVATGENVADSDESSSNRASGSDLFEPDGITPSDAGRRAVQAVATELSLPAPAPIAETPGDEPYQKLARDRRFDEFRRKAARYVQLKKELLPLGRKLADGTATPAERELHNRLEDAIAVEFKPINRYLWDSRWSESDRAAMGWIMFVKPD